MNWDLVWDDGYVLEFSFTCFSLFFFFFIHRKCSLIAIQFVEAHTNLGYTLDIVNPLFVVLGVEIRFLRVLPSVVSSGTTAGRTLSLFHVIQINLLRIN